MLDLTQQMKVFPTAVSDMSLDSEIKAKSPNLAPG